MVDNLQYNRQKHQPKIKLGDLVRTADFRRVFGKGDSTNYSYKVYTITEVKHVAILSSRINYLPERYNQNILRPTILALGENNQVMKKLNIFQKNNKF